MLKDSIIRYVKEHTGKTDLRALDTTLTANDIADHFKVKRNTVSLYLNQEVGKTLFKINTRPVRFLDKGEFERRFFPVSKDIYDSVKELLDEDETAPAEEEHYSKDDDSVFGNIVGANGSLKKALSQIRTSLFYPNTSLPIFLYGPTGAGKSFMAKKIHEFAIQQEILKEDAPFVVMNCAQYANNVELLSSNLFGYVKGAFTGAYSTTKGLLEAADEGILFLDEVHRLNSESQEKLFVFLDQGIFRRMGESDGWHRANVRIIMATTEDLQSNFLGTFLRRIPIVIRIPSLNERDERERVQFIYYFLIKESRVFNRTIRVSGKVLEVLLKYPYQGNIGDLENKIKYICASAYAKENRGEEIRIHFEHLPDDMVKSIADTEENKIGNFHAIEIRPDMKVEDLFKEQDMEKDYYFELFQKLIMIFEQFQTQKYAKEQFENRCIHAVDDVLNRLVYSQDVENENAMRKYIVNCVREAFRYLEYSCNVQLGGNSLHAVTAYFFYKESAFLKRIYIPSGLMDYIFSEYPREVRIAEKILDILSTKMDIVSGKEDIIAITLYIRGLLKTSKMKKQPRAIIIAHGYATASSVADVANRILNEFIFESVDMPIEKKVSDIVDWVKNYIAQNDISYGIILMVDMGSLQDIYHSIEKELDSTMAIINNISTQMAIIVGELIQRREKIEDIVKILQEKNRTEYRIIYPERKKQKMILTCCITGTGTAEQIRRLMEESIPQELNIQVVSYDYDQLQNEEIIKELYKTYEVLGVVGTKDPEIGSGPFIPLDQLVSGEAVEKITEMLKKVSDSITMDQINNSLVHNFSMNRLMGFLTILDTEKILNYIETALDEYEFITGKKLKNSTRISCCIHVGCLVERLIRNAAIGNYPSQEEFEKIHRVDIEQIQQVFSVIEQTYRVKIPVSEIGYIYDILTEI